MIKYNHTLFFHLLLIHIISYHPYFYAPYILYLYQYPNLLNFHPLILKPNYLLHNPFLITLFAGLSTSIGGLVVFFGNTEKLNWLSFTMSFAAGVMLYVSFVEILPESFIEFNQSHETNRAFLYVFSFFIIGVFFAILTDKLLPEQKINSQVNKSLISKNNKIYRSGLLITLTMALHNFPEGMVTFIGSVNDLSFGLVIGLSRVG